MKHYYSNDAYFGILRNLYVMSDGGIKPTKEHFDIYLGQFSLQKYKYEKRFYSSTDIYTWAASLFSTSAHVTRTLRKALASILLK